MRTHLGSALAAGILFLLGGALPARAGTIGYAMNGEHLYTVDVQTGAATFIGDTNLPGLVALAATPAGVVYGERQTGSGVNELYTINVQTGVPTLVATLTIPSNVDFGGIDYFGGSLYAVDLDFGSTRVFNFALSGGTATDLGAVSTGYPTHGSGLAMIDADSALILGSDGLGRNLLGWERQANGSIVTIDYGEIDNASGVDYQNLGAMDLAPNGEFYALSRSGKVLLLDFTPGVANSLVTTEVATISGSTHLWTALAFVDAPVDAVPEPVSGALLGLGAVALAVRRRSTRRS